MKKTKQNKKDDSCVLSWQTATALLASLVVVELFLRPFSGRFKGLVIFVMLVSSFGFWCLCKKHREKVQQNQKDFVTRFLGVVISLAIVAATVGMCWFGIQSKIIYFSEQDFASYFVSYYEGGVFCAVKVASWFLWMPFFLIASDVLSFNTEKCKITNMKSIMKKTKKNKKEHGLFDLGQLLLHLLCAFMLLVALFKFVFNVPNPILTSAVILVVFAVCVFFPLLVLKENAKVEKKWLESAAKKNNPYAQYDLGKFLEREGDLKGAKKWYEKAANQKHERAYYRLKKVSVIRSLL